MQKLLVGTSPSTWDFGSNWPRWSEIADFRSIFARIASAVRPNEKSSIIINRKSTARFSMSLRWSSYVASKSPKGAQERKTAVTLWNRTSLEESLLQSLFVWKLSAQSCRAVTGLSMQKVLVGDVPFYMKFGSNWPRCSEIADFFLFLYFLFLHVTP